MDSSDIKGNDKDSGQSNSKPDQTVKPSLKLSSITQLIKAQQSPRLDKDNSNSNPNQIESPLLKKTIEEDTAEDQLSSEFQESVNLTDEEAAQDMDDQYEDQDQNHSLFNVDGFIIQAIDHDDQEVFINLKKSKIGQGEYLMFFTQVIGPRSPESPTPQQSPNNMLGLKSMKNLKSKLPSPDKQNPDQTDDNNQKHYKPITFDQIKEIMIYLPADFFSLKQKQEWMNMMKDCDYLYGDAQDQSEEQDNDSYSDLQYLKKNKMQSEIVKKESIKQKKRQRRSTLCPSENMQMSQTAAQEPIYVKRKPRKQTMFLSQNEDIYDVDEDDVEV